VGGAQRFVVNLSRELVRRGYPVDIVLASAQGPLLEVAPPQARIVDLKSRHVIASLPGLVRYLRAERPAALLTVQTHCNIAGILAQRIAPGFLRLGQGGRHEISERIHPRAIHSLETSTRVVVTEHNSLTSRMVRRLSKEAFLLRLTRLLYPYAQGIVVVSRRVSEELTEITGLGTDRITTIHNPIVSEELFALANAPLEHPWFAPGQLPVVLSVGRLVPQKDQTTLLRAFGRLRARRPARLVILGEGPERQRLQSLAEALGVEGDVDLPGFDTNPYSFMRGCAAFVLSSAWEGLPTVLVEAMACGASVVSTDCPSGPAEILDDGEFGSLVPVGDDEALAAAIEASLDHPTPRETLLGRAADFSVAKSADAYLKILLPESL